jgi:hypothetical protein
MKFPPLPLALLYGVPVLACAGITCLLRQQSAPRVYSVQQAERLAGRSILVRGRIVQCQPLVTVGNQPCLLLVPDTCPASSADCTDPVRDEALTVLLAPPTALLAQLRQVPLLGSLLPAPQHVHWGQRATYRVQIALVPNSLCGSTPCEQALLLDATP